RSPSARLARRFPAMIRRIRSVAQVAEGRIRRSYRSCFEDGSRVGQAGDESAFGGCLPVLALGCREGRYRERNANTGKVPPAADSSPAWPHWFHQQQNGTAGVPLMRRGLSEGGSMANGRSRSGAGATRTALRRLMTVLAAFAT